MLPLSSNLVIWLCREPTDMRRSYEGLSSMVRQRLGEDPLSGAFYVFVNRRRTMMKVLYFESDGYCIWSKRLERGQFQVRFDGASKQSLTRRDWQCLIEGIDLRTVRRLKRYDVSLKDRRRSL